VHDTLKIEVKLARRWSFNLRLRMRFRISSGPGVFLEASRRSSWLESGWSLCGEATLTAVLILHESILSHKQLSRSSMARKSTADLKIHSP